MRSRDIVRKAWQITQAHLKKLIMYGAVPAFFSMVVSSGYLTYQIEAFKSSALFSDSESATGDHMVTLFYEIGGWISSHPWMTITTIVVAILFFACYVLLPPVLNGALIEALSRIDHFKSLEGSFEVGVRRFFPMFEFGLLTGSFSIVTLFTESSFVLRWWGENVFFMVLPFLLFVAMVGLIVSLLFTYSEFYIVLKKEDLIVAMKESTILVISNLKRTILVLILMILISARIILNVILILVIPMILILLSSYFANFLFSLWGFIFLGVFGTAILLVSSYLLGLFHIFATAVWLLTFSELTEKKTETETALD